MLAWVCLGLFVGCYALFVVLPDWRAYVAMAGAVLTVACGALPFTTAITESISWNVLGLFLGTLVLAELFMWSKAPAVLAEFFVDLCKSGRGAMLALCVLASVISMFVENVAVVMLLAPVALSLAKHLNRSPVPLLIGIAVSSNLQGTATMIGDPPSMIFAGFMKMGFWDFFVIHGKPGIFFAVQVGGIASLLVLAWVFRHAREQAVRVRQERVRSKVPSVLLLVLVAGLSCATLADPEFAWFAGVWTMALAAVGLVWFHRREEPQAVGKLLATLDWGTTFFLLGIFVLVAGLSHMGWMERLAGVLAQSAGSDVFVGFVLIVVLSVVVSGFVDNVPFLLVMIPVVQQMARAMDAPLEVLMYGLLIGACLGGNLTPIGASANVVTMGILRKHGYRIGFKEFGRIGLPFTAAAVSAACAFVWVVWR